MMDLEKIRTFYPRLEEVVSKLSSEQLNAPNKAGGWSPRQYLHHLADAQTQAFYRCVWLLTEDNTILKTFDQDNWVDLLGNYPIEGSMDMLKGVYARWILLLENLKDWQYDVSGTHPELGEISVRKIIEYYTEHAEGHIKQFTQLSE